MPAWYLPVTMSVAPVICSTVPSEPRKRSPSPKWLLLNVDCHSTVRSLGNSNVTAIVSGTCLPSLSEYTPPIMPAASGSGRSIAVMIHAIWCTMFSVTLPPENSQNRRQFIYLLASNAIFGRLTRNRSQFTCCGLQSAGISPYHWPRPCGVLRLIHDSTIVTLPNRPALYQRRASANSPELSCCSPICTTCLDFCAACRHSTASGMSHVMVFSQYTSFPAASASTTHLA